MSDLGSYEAPLRHRLGCLAGCLLLPVLLWFGFLGLVWLFVSGMPPAPCETTRSEVPSPDGRYLGVIERPYCALGATGSSVDLTARLEHDSEAIVLVGMRRGRSTVSFSWQDGSTLVVEYRPDGNDAHPLYHVGPAQWNGVRLVYHDGRS